MFGIANTYNYVKDLTQDRFALWWQERSGSGLGGIQFRVYDSTVIQQIHDWRSSLPEASENRIGAREIATFAIPLTLDDGPNRVDLPREFLHDMETLVL